MNCLDTQKNTQRVDFSTWTTKVVGMSMSWTFERKVHTSDVRRLLPGQHVPESAARGNNRGM